MKKICSTGCKASSVDQKTLGHYLLVTPKKWAQDALKGMINKAVKTIMREGFEKYKEAQTGNINPDYSVIIPGILSLPEFRIEQIATPQMVRVKRTEQASQEIWENGFDIEDHEETALNALYEDPEEMLRWFMENKIYQRRKALVKEKETLYIKDKKAFPAAEDDLINFIVSETGYKNRAQAEEELAITT